MSRDDSKNENGLREHNRPHDAKGAEGLGVDAGPDAGLDEEGLGMAPGQGPSSPDEESEERDGKGAREAAKLPLFARACDFVGLPPHKVLYLISDLCVLYLALLVAILLRALMGNYVNWQESLPTTFVIVLFSPFIATAMGLYTDTFLRSPPETLYRIVWFVSTMFAIMFVVFFFAKEGGIHSRLVYLMGWALACFGVPLARFFLQRRFSRAPWWGAPLVFLNRTQMGKAVWHYLRKHPEKGFRPVCFVDLPLDIDKAAQERLKKVALKYRGAVAMVAADPTDLSRSTLSTLTQVFSRLLVMPLAPETEAVRKFNMVPFALDTTTGFFLQIRLHDKRRLLVKRAMDLALCAAGAVVLLPLFVLLALAVRVDSKGPVFYTQRRVGQGGKTFRMHKFRTMVVDADKKLKECLERDPELAAEWARDQKLKIDPRVTRVGKILRRTSLDELPQLIDVVRGDMTLVGPRPIVDAEKAKYGDLYQDYIRVRPGITGLWQISGRNDTSYKERVELDFFYVSNWTVWLDIWILAKTVPVVIFRRGAY